MTNKEIANQFKLLAQLMELHGEEPYRLKSYNNAYRSLRAISEPLIEMSLTELKSIKGVGDAISRKIQELQLNKKMRLIEEYLELTPKGIVDLLGIKGLGIKKIMTLWKDLEVQSPGELLYACNENRLTALKGFGKKTQANIKQQLEYYFQSLDRYRWASVAEDAENIWMDLEDVVGDENVAITGAFRRQLPVVDFLELLVVCPNPDIIKDSGLLTDFEAPKGKNYWQGKSAEGQVSVRLYPTTEEYFGLNLLRSTGGANFVKDLLGEQSPENFKGLSEAEIFEKLEFPWLEPELRDYPKIFWLVNSRGLPEVVESKDIKGVLHLHSNYSDGAPKIKQLANYIKGEGYAYMGMTDHSQSAFYANGLKEDRLKEQWEEIDALNAKSKDFHIFKGIESDIKYDGSLDYPDEILGQFDFIIASVHAHLKMSKEKATERIIRAVKNPYTTILGHPTGRLLLAREGYPLDHKAVIDACAAHDVAIEINANPLRLDIDYQWLPYALEKGVKIAINPDAHSLEGVHDIRYGLQMARKGLLTAENCISCWTKEQFGEWIKGRLEK